MCIYEGVYAERTRKVAKLINTITGPIYDLYSNIDLQFLLVLYAVNVDIFLQNGDKIMVSKMAASQLSPAHSIHEMLLFLISDLRLFRNYLSQHNMFSPTVRGVSYTWTVIEYRG
jgi:acyl-CoA thioesterase